MGEIYASSQTQFPSLTNPSQEQTTQGEALPDIKLPEKETQTSKNIAEIWPSFKIYHECISLL